jgi:hypothetical protein
MPLGDLTNFTQDFRTAPSGTTYDWAIAISGDAMSGLLARVATALQQTNIFETSVGPVRLAVTQASAQWGSPMTFAGQAQITFNGNDEIDVDFTAQGQFTMDQGELSLYLTVQNTANSLIDRLFHYGSDRQNAGSDALGSALLGAFHSQFNRFTPDPGSEATICWVGTSTDHGDLDGKDLDQAADQLRFFGSVSAQIPGRPELSIVDDTTGETVNFSIEQGIPTATIDFVEDQRSYCSGSPLPTLIHTLSLRNSGTGPLFICEISGPDIGGGFQCFVFGAVPLALDPGREWQIAIEYCLGRVSSQGLLRIRCNQPPEGLPASIGMSWFNRVIIPQMLAGHTTFTVVPPQLDIRVANSKTGAPRLQLGPHCHPVEVKVPAGTFEICNTGDNPLYLCATNQDSTGIFELPFVPSRIDAGQCQEFGILFFPAAVPTPYSFNFVLSSSEGDITVPVQGQVESLPRLGAQGDWVDLVTGTLCVPPNLVCRLMNGFGGVEAQSVPIMQMAIEDAPPESNIEIGNSEGETLVTDYSGDPWRAHELAFTATADGIPVPTDPCVILVQGPGPDPPPDWIRVDVTGNVIQPIGQWEAPGDIGPVIAHDGWVYAASGDGVLIVDWRSATDPTVAGQLSVGAVSASALDGPLMVAATSDRLFAFDVTRPDRPELLAQTPVSEPVSSLATSEGWILAASGDAIAVFVLRSGRLLVQGSIDLPRSAAWVGVVGANFYAAGEQRVVLFRLNSAARAHLLGAYAPRQRMVRIAAYRRNLLASSNAGTTMLRIDRTGELRPVADYRKPHWSLGYMPDPAAKRLVQLASARSLRAWAVRPRRLDRSKFPDLLELQYRPQRPS